MTADGPAPSLRDWAFAVHGRPGVETQCLRLQDRHGMDVVAVLWCIWAGEHHGAIDAEAMGRIVTETRAWQADIVGPLRRIRRRLKPPDGSTAPRPGDGESVGAGADDADRTARDRLRRQVADAELAAETIQLDQLHTATSAASAASAVIGPSGAAAVRANLACLVSVSGQDPDPARDAAMEALLASVESARS